MPKQTFKIAEIIERIEITVEKQQDDGWEIDHEQAKSIADAKIAQDHPRLKYQDGDGRAELYSVTFVYRA